MEKPLQVLLVEDSEDDALLMIRALKKGGYDPVVERVEAAGAMRKSLQKKPWDVILCDYQLPQFNGLAAIALLKDTGVDIPLIIVSGAIGEETAVECMRLGARDYIMKDNLSRLVPAIERELKEAESRILRQLAEKALGESEERYRTILDEMEEGYQEVDLAGNFTFFNEAWLKLFGYSRDEMMGTNFSRYAAEEAIAKKVYRAYNQMYKTGLPIKSYEWDIIRKDGARRTHEFYASILRDSKDRPTGFRGIVRDITDSKRVEEALRKSEEQYRNLFENANEAIFVAQDGKLVFVNPMTVRLIDYSSEELISRPFIEFIQMDDRKMVYDRYVRRMQGEEVPQNYSFRIIHRNGNIRWVELSAVLINWKGKPATLNFMSDITDRKQTEKALRESETLFRKLFEDHTAVKLIIDPDTGSLVDANEAAAQYYGWSRERLKAMKITDINTLTPEEVRKEMEKAVAKKGIHFEFRHRLANGSIRDVAVFTGSIENKGKVLLHSIIHDITERKWAEAHLQETLERLKRAINATIQVMVSAIEVRDPYTSGHQLRSANLARVIATEMGLPPNIIDGLRMAGSIHDIGKLSIPAEILSKPTKLTVIEFALIQEHSRSGYEMLKDVESPWPLAEIVYQHHERMDGSGYPRNLKGDEILMEARIMAVADVVESMASHRPYRPALGLNAALEEIENHKGTLYDAGAVDACLRLFREKGYHLAST